jgi:hypothetical protein
VGSKRPDFSAGVRGVFCAARVDVSFPSCVSAFHIFLKQKKKKKIVRRC